jgi:acyl-CoA synthetase (NDP forming)
VVNGGNCLGIRSEPGGYDATFIPKYKLPPDEKSHPVALISASGAFAVAKTSKFGFNPRYSISIGNQIDLTIGDYLAYLKDDLQTEIFAIYAEGFQPLDGLAFLEAAREITASGRTVILYRAGRTAAGARASASHTAAIAGDYAVTRELAAAAGVLVCDTLEEFDDLVQLFALLGSKRVAGLRLGALSNAGFECVAIADHLGALELAQYAPATTAALRSLLEQHGLADIVEVRNPVDLTPILDDAAFAEAARIVLTDEKVDVGLIGCVPLTAALDTLPPHESDGEDLSADESVARWLIRLKDETAKAWVAVVDGGAMFDDLAHLLEADGVPTFRSADRALRAFGRFCHDRLRSAG